MARRISVAAALVSLSSITAGNFHYVLPDWFTTSKCDSASWCFGAVDAFSLSLPTASFHFIRCAVEPCEEAHFEQTVDEITDASTEPGKTIMVIGWMSSHPRLAGGGFEYYGLHAQPSAVSRYARL